MGTRLVFVVVGCWVYCVAPLFFEVWIFSFLIIFLIVGTMITLRIVG